MLSEIILLLTVILLGLILVPFVSVRFKKKAEELFFISAMLSYSIFLYVLWILSLLVGFSVYSVSIAIVLVFLINIPYIGAFINGLPRLSLPKISRDSVMPYLIPLIFFLLFITHRAVNPNLGADMWHTSIVGSITEIGDIPPANPWFSGATLFYPYGYHLFISTFVSLTGAAPGVVMNVVIPYFGFLLVLGMYVLVKKITSRRRAGLLASVFVISGSLSGLLVLLFVASTGAFPSEINFSLGRIPLPFEVSALRLTADASGMVSTGLLDTGINAPFPSLYHFAGESFPFSFPFLIFMFCFVLDFFKNRKWIDTVIISIAFASLGLIYIFNYVLIFFAIVLYSLVVFYQRRRKSIPDLIHTGKLLFLGLVFLAPNLLSVSSKVMWVPYLQSLALGMYVLYYGPLLFFAIIGVLYLYKIRKLFKQEHLFFVCVFLVAMFFVTAIFPSNMFDSYHKFLVLSWFPMAVFAAIGADKFISSLKSFKSWMRFLCSSIFVIFLSLLLLAPGLQLGLDYGIIDGGQEDLLVTSNITDFDIHFHFPPQKYIHGDLDPFFWMSIYYPLEQEAISWIQENTLPGSIFLEAYQERYVTGPLIPTMAQRPVVLGWYDPMRQYGYPGNEIAERIADIDTIYNSTDNAAKLLLMEKYGASYVWIGVTEKGRYSPAGISAFLNSSYFEEVFSNERVKIFQITE